MELACETLDDLLLNIYPHLIGAPLVDATRGISHELIAVSARIAKPRARLSRSETRGKAFSCLGELIWYLSKSNALAPIKRYISAYANDSEDGETVYGGYGPRLFGTDGQDQVANVIQLLRESPTSRRAVIQLFSAADISVRRKEIPCTTTLQFIARGDSLHMITNMRSNDAYKGLPHDIFCFTMIQEIIARALSLEVGAYHHMVGSLHLYENDVADAQALVSEHYQRRIEMPPMPVGDPWPAIAKLVESEACVRAGGDLDANELFDDPYWADLVRLLQIFHTKDDTQFEVLKSDMQFDGYKTYIRDRAAKRSAATAAAGIVAPEQAA